MKPPVINEVEIGCSPAMILSAFYDPEHLKGWWGVEKSLIELRTGGVFTLAWDYSEAGVKYVSSGLISNFKPAARLCIENMIYVNPARSILGPMTMDISVAKTEIGGHLKVIQDGYQSGGDWDWYHEAVVDAWPKALQFLKNYLESVAK